MISGRGLGITGGTLDKLDSIPGFQTLLPARRIVAIVQKVGCVICGQTERMVPADKKMYALRDVTGTVPSIPLITASILSKKLAEGLDALVLDVKYGRAAFMQTKAEAARLARAMVRLGNHCGVTTRALLTDMNTPLGRAAGNWLEIKESVACLAGRGPEDLRQLVVACAAHLLVLTGRVRSLGAGKKQAEDCLTSGAPLRKWEEMLAAQGADLGRFRRKLERDRNAKVVTALPATHAGRVLRCDARLVGEVVRDLGGGRLTQDATVNPDVGIDEMVQPGETVDAGAVLCRIHADSKSSAAIARQRLAPAFAVERKNRIA
jgi:pyrimidine-nucleoside phosphorylase